MSNSLPKQEFQFVQIRHPSFSRLRREKVRKDTPVIIKTRRFRFQNVTDIEYGDIVISLKKKTFIPKSSDTDVDIILQQVSENPTLSSNISLPFAEASKVIPLNPQEKERDTFRHPSVFHYLKEFFKFASVTAVTFVIILVGMNFSAYYQMTTYWISQWSGETSMQTKNLEAFVDKTNSGLSEGYNGGIPYLPTAGNALPVNMKVLPPDNRVVIPKIGKNAPIVEIPVANLVKQDWQALEKDIQDGLRSGVVHYPGTATPGQKGNVFITGHSSYYFWEKSPYKDIFALLPEIGVGDKVIVYYNGKEYAYEIIEKKIVPPSDTDVLQQTDDYRLTLMTCYPVGTDLNRMILVGKRVGT